MKRDIDPGSVKYLKYGSETLALKKLSQSRNENQTKGTFVSTNRLNNKDSNSVHYQVLVMTTGKVL